MCVAGAGRGALSGVDGCWVIRVEGLLLLPNGTNAMGLHACACGDPVGIGR